MKRDLADVWDADRVVVVSQFAPTQPWLASGAMRRNETIVGLSAAILVVEAAEKGGTLHAGQCGLSDGRPVYTLECHTTRPAGNEMLIAAGATPVSSVEMLERAICGMDAPGPQFSLL